MKKLLFLCAVFTIVLPSWILGQPSKAPDWGGATCVWHEPDANTVAQINEPRYLRLTFNVAAKPTSGELWITVDNVYVVYVNGQKIGADSEWSTVEKYDVAKHLVLGKNVLAIKA